MQGRIPQNFIDDLLNRVDIVETVNARVPLKKSGKNYSACCPFHDEKTPSFTVSPTKQFYYCFGCGAGGNAIGFVMEFDRVGFPEAVELLATQAGVEVPREAAPDARVEKKRKDIFDILQQADQYFRTKLRDSKLAIDYLKSRGLDGRTARDFGIGYAPEGWDHLLNLLGNDDEQRKLLIDSGLIIERDDQSGFYDRFRHRVMFPIRDLRGRTIAFGGRVLDDSKPKYLNSPETPVFHKSRELYGLFEALRANRHLKRLLVVEGYMDVVMLAQFGVRNAVATLGTSVGQPHIEKMFRHVAEIVFCFDGDNAGRSAAERALEAVLPAMLDGRKVGFLFLPEGEDPDSLVRQEGQEAFEHRVAKSMPLSTFLFECAGRGLDLATDEGKAALSQQVLAMIGQLPKGAFRNLIVNHLAEQTNQTPAQIAELISSSVPAPRAAPNRDEPPPPPEDSPVRREQSNRYRRVEVTPMRQLIALLLSHPDLAERLPDDAEEMLAAADEFPYFDKLLTQLRKTPGANFSALVGRLASDPGSIDYFNRLAGAMSVTDELEAAAKELDEIVERYRRRYREAQLKDALRELDRIEPKSLSDAQRSDRRRILEELRGLRS